MTLCVGWSDVSLVKEHGYVRVGGCKVPGLKLCGASPAAPRSAFTRPLLVSRTWVLVESGIVYVWNMSS